MADILAIILSCYLLNIFMNIDKPKHSFESPQPVDLLGLRSNISSIDDWKPDDIEHDINHAYMKLNEDITGNREFDKMFFKTAKMQILAKLQFVSGYLKNKDNSYVANSIEKVIQELDDIDPENEIDEYLKNKRTLQDLAEVIKTDSSQMFVSTYAISFVIDPEEYEKYFSQLGLKERALSLRYPLIIVKNDENYEKEIVKGEISMLSGLFDMTAENMDPQNVARRKFVDKFYNKYDRDILDNPDIFRKAFIKQIEEDLQEKD